MSPSLHGRPSAESVEAIAAVLSAASYLRYSEMQRVILELTYRDTLMLMGGLAGVAVGMMERVSHLEDRPYEEILTEYCLLNARLAESLR